MLRKFDMRTGFASVKRFDGHQIKDIAGAIKASADGGTFTGYGSVFDVVDSYNEIVAPGAFAKSIADIKAGGRALPVLWNHNSSEPIGKYVELAEDDHGLKVKGELLIGAVARAKEIAELVAAGVVSGLSIGYQVVEWSKNEETGVYTLEELKLREVSICTFPANGEARIESIKSKLAHGGHLTIRECEQLLRDAGLSKTEAIRMTRGGYSAYAGEGDPAGDEKAVIDALAEMRDAFSTKTK